MAIEIIMLLLGLATHFLKALLQMKLAGNHLTPIEYWRGHPYQSGLAVVGAVVGFVALYESGNLTSINAFGIGYMANSVADVLGGRAQGKL